ncbi:unnamed protein product [Amoebophrya sp. A25]|nr:unnamed protein product [Amoebophrya sp. A25]|eukprot:GSA25T00007740001.1
MTGSTVVLHVYDLIDQTPLCCGFFHTGVVVRGVEWSFGAGGGIAGGRPGANLPDGCRFREALEIGTIEHNADIGRAIDRIRPEFPSDSYSVVFNNCNDFSNRMCEALLRKGIPGYINRLARLGRHWPCRYFIPVQYYPPSGVVDIPRAPLLPGGGNRVDGESTVAWPWRMWARVKLALVRFPTILNREQQGSHEQVDSEAAQLTGVSARDLQLRAAEGRSRPSNSV